MSRVPERIESEPDVLLLAPRRKRLVLVAGLSLGALAVIVPAAAYGCLAIFLLLSVLLLWPGGAATRRPSLAGSERSELVWPGRGMKAVVEALGEPAFLVDREMLLRYRNPASSVAFGNMALGDAISLRFRSPDLLSNLEMAVRDGLPQHSILEERRPIERHWQVEILPIPPYQGERPRFFLLSFRDRTSELRIERMRTDFVANASHELRTPLASLTGFIETLQGPARNDAAARDRFLQIMREQALRMSRLIDDLLSLSRIEMKRHVPIVARCDLGALLARVHLQMEPLAEEAGAKLTLSLPHEPVEILGEEDELIQVFSNLVENASKYGASGGRIEIELMRVDERGEPMVDVSVRDHGPGIPSEHVPRLTERFYRVDIGTSRGKDGTGLGLSITRNILLRHRSRLLIASTPGEGATFTARFPVPSRPADQFGTVGVRPLVAGGGHLSQN